MPCPLRCRPSLALRVVVGVLLVTSAAARGSRDPAGATETAAEPAAARHLVLISIDTLRADRLGCYGNDRPTSPAIDGVAASGTRFAEALAPAPWTKPSHASLLTGLLPAHHGAVSMTATLRAGATTLAERLSAVGFRSIAVVNSSWLASHGLERGFAEFHSVDYAQGYRPGSRITAETIRRLGAVDGSRRLFLFVHYMDAHSDYASLPRYESMFVRPYEGPFDGTTQQLYAVAEGRMPAGPGDFAHLLDLYDAGVRQVDDQVGHLLDWLDRRGILGDALVVIVSDHGEEFGEHGGVLHGHTQFREVVHVPLILRGPHVPAGGAVDGPVSLTDVVPTALDLLGLAAPTGLDGRDLVPALGGATLTDRPLIQEADVVFPPPGPGPAPVGARRAVREGRYCLHVDLASGEVSLFDVRVDPGETRDVRVDHRAVASRLLDVLRRHVATSADDASDEPLSDEQLERLRSLGYLGRP